MVRIDERVRRRHKRRNTVQALLLLGGLVLMLSVAAVLVFGLEGLVLVGVAALGALWWRPRVPPELVLRMYRAVRLPVAAAPDLHRLVGALARRADLPRLPELYYVPSSMLNAFAVGRPDDSAIAVTDGLLRSLTGRELAGVLAHEISHVRGDDVWIMTLADTVGRITHALAYAGLLVIFLVGLPFVATGTVWPLLLAGLFTGIPTVVTLLQLALSRAREYEADLEAVSLTGDPDGLVSALLKLDLHEGRIWERILVPHRRTPDLLLLRTHPPTEERVRRLRSLSPPPVGVRLPEGPYAPSGYVRVQGPVRIRAPASGADRTETAATGPLPARAASRSQDTDAPGCVPRPRRGRMHPGAGPRCTRVRPQTWVRADAPGCRSRPRHQADRWE